MSANFFITTLRKCGIHVGIDGDSPITITCHETSKSFRQLDSQFRIQRSKIDEFLTSMNAFFDLEGALLASLRSLEELGPQEVEKMNNMYGQTDTFLKLLLRIEALQDSAIETLLGKMLWLMGEVPVASSQGSNSHSQILRQQSEQERLATQIFNHIRWCEVGGGICSMLYTRICTTYTILRPAMNVIVAASFALSHC